MKRTYLLLALGFVLGGSAFWLFNFTLKATNTEAFCLSCHEMHIPNDRLLTTAHGSNRLGLKVECSACHVPEAFVPKMVRKIEASREVWGHLLGTIDTPEKYEAHRERMRERELDRMIAADSAECRACHNPAHWSLEDQSSVARTRHETMKDEGKTCVNCHDDVAHPLVSAIEDDTFGF